MLNFQKEISNNNLENLTLNFLNITEQAAISSYNWAGMGDEKNADLAAVSSMRENLNKLDISGFICVGEGERDNAPLLQVGECVGLKNSANEIDIALDPLEGTTLCANNSNNSLSVLAFAQRGSFLVAPDIYMKKIAVGRGVPKDLILLDNSVERNIRNLAHVRKKNMSDMVICVLNRPRHEEIIAEIRECGARVKLIQDGDIMGAAATVLNEAVDMYIGIGGSPEGVLAASILKSLGGQMQGKLMFSAENEVIRAKKIGISDTSKIYSLNDMVVGDSIFIATGVTDGEFLSGVKANHSQHKLNSLIVSDCNVRYVESTKLRVEADEDL